MNKLKLRLNYRYFKGIRYGSNPVMISLQFSHHELNCPGDGSTQLLMTMKQCLNGWC